MGGEADGGRLGSGFLVDRRGRVLTNAHVIDDAEKAKLWPICVKHYHEYDDYQARTDRNIPVFVCEPR